CARCTTALDYW
nr:immunoglobulin heavy chain junction region [Mus musculus]MBK4186348.1 immunoglobulin heavy chain junction region [Mus musculus]MBK4186349.1 immunoglobulin heavy chain junction region [Mus musculus]